MLILLTELCVRVRAQDKEELATLLPVINKRITKAARASTDCIRVKDCVNSWWEQPAQFTTPWVKVENMTFQQWYSQWRIIATKIRQLIDVQT
ncbi:hypothetical protein V1264_016867 [Littorina saxatilis]|uniref:Uncharacterized protein n=1 Tax=Littorina saxatilis TaxID=31220 RepID=A0AAN9BHY6_9CAEN